MRVSLRVCGLLFIPLRQFINSIIIVMTKMVPGWRVALAATLPGILLIATPLLLLSRPASKSQEAGATVPMAGQVQGVLEQGQIGGSYGAQYGGQYPAQKYTAPQYQYTNPQYENNGEPLSGKDAEALAYASARDKLSKLHALAQASRENDRLRNDASKSALSQWTQGMTGGHSIADLNKLHGGIAVYQARARIAKVLAESQADDKLRKAVLDSAKEASSGNGNSWNKLLSREVGPQKLAMASDWLSTEVAAAPKSKKGPIMAREQLEAALSRVGGKFRGRPIEDKSEHGNRGLAFEQQALGRVMSRAHAAVDDGELFGGNQGGQPSEEGSAQRFTARGAGEDSPQGAPAPSNGPAPGLSSYDAQILANGPPA